MEIIFLQHVKKANVGKVCKLFWRCFLLWGKFWPCSITLKILNAWNFYWSLLSTDWTKYVGKDFLGHFARPGKGCQIFLRRYPFRSYCWVAPKVLRRIFLSLIALRRNAFFHVSLWINCFFPSCEWIEFYPSVEKSKLAIFDFSTYAKDNFFSPQISIPPPFWLPHTSEVTSLVVFGGYFLGATSYNFLP